MAINALLNSFHCHIPRGKDGATRKVFPTKEKQKESGGMELHLHTSYRSEEREDCEGDGVLCIALQPPSLETAMHRSEASNFSKSAGKEDLHMKE